MYYKGIAHTCSWAMHWVPVQTYYALAGFYTRLLGNGWGQRATQSKPIR